MLEMPALLEQCAPQVAPALMNALVRAESAWKPLAIGMDSTQGAVKQPATLDEAVSAATALQAAGRKFSVGLAQVHVSHVLNQGLTWEQAFDPCRNLAIGQSILWDFHRRASALGYSGISAIWAALRGYNTGGLDRTAGDGYAQRVLSYLYAKPSVIGEAMAGRLPAVRLAEPVPSAGPSARRARPGESLEIFEKEGAAAGF